MTDDLAGIDSQALDISFLVTYAKKLPETDPSKVAVVKLVGEGYRVGSRRRGPPHSGLAERDGSIRYYRDSSQALQTSTHSN